MSPDPSSVRALVDRYLAEESPLKAATTQRHDASYAATVLETWGDLSIGQVTPGLVSKFHRRLTAERGPILANRILSFVSQVCNLAERDDLRPAHSNPTRAIRRNRECGRTEFLAAPMRARFLDAASAALAAGEITRSAWILLGLLLLAGVRWSEARLLRWEEVDLANKCLRFLPRGETRTENKSSDQRSVSLNDDAYDLLRLAPRVSAWVVPNPRTLRPYTDIRKPLRRVLTRAGVRITPHGLRHSFATEAAEAGCTVLEISMLLGQRSQTSAERYIHLVGAQARSAAQKVGRGRRQQLTDREARP